MTQKKPVWIWEKAESCISVACISAIYVFFSELQHEYFLCSGSKENQKVAKTLLEMWASVESDMKKHAESLLR